MREPPRGAPAGASVGGAHENKGECGEVEAGGVGPPGQAIRRGPSRGTGQGTGGLGRPGATPRRMGLSWAHVEPVMALRKHRVSDYFQEVLAALVLPLSAWWAL